MDVGDGSKGSQMRYWWVRLGYQDPNNSPGANSAQSLFCK